RTLGSLFFACSDEMEDLSLVEALQRILSLAMEQIRSTGIVAEDVALSLVDSIMSIAIDMIQTGQRLLRSSHAITTN
ncbi:MAG: IS4 family transposase, partial [Proteobacteria bacterium]|nr:IS4 family transposase [Pseudomonadota bacterium]